MRWRYFITMWGHPRMAAWALLTTLVFALVRVPFARMQIIPFVAEFHPGFVLAPAAGVFGGPAGVLGVLAGSLLGDALLGLWGPMSGYRAAGQVFAALSAHALWWAAPRDAGETTEPMWREALRFMAAGAPGAFSAAAFHGLGADTAHFYPFPAVAMTVLINNLLFLVLFAPAVIDVYRRHGFPAFGNWATVMDVDVSVSRSAVGPVLIGSGGLAAYALGLLVGRWSGGHPASGPAVLGTWSGWPVHLVVWLCLGVQLVGIILALRPRRSPRVEPVLPASRPDLRYLRPLK